MWLKTILGILLNLQIILSEEVGDSCTNRNFSEGTCVSVLECEEAIRQIQTKRRHDFERCGFEGTMEIVCCPRTSTDTRINTSTEKSNNLRKADRECQKYIDSAIQALDYHILGGEAVSLGEFPHMVALAYQRQTGRGYTFDCGGSIISKDYVLTASHCVINIDEIEPTFVRTGVVEIGGNEYDPETDVGIAQIITHPQYTRREKYHDLALLRLNRSLTFSSNLNAACLQTINVQPTSKLYITGWGQTSNTRDAKSTTLLKADVIAVSSEKCGESYAEWRKLPQGIIDTQLCAGDPKGIKDTCQGDSGGPLQSFDQENVYRIIGITSFGRGCGSPVPGVYTRVALYVPWIESVVWP